MWLGHLQQVVVAVSLGHTNLHMVPAQPVDSAPCMLARDTTSLAHRTCAETLCQTFRLHTAVCVQVHAHFVSIHICRLTSCEMCVNVHAPPLHLIASARLAGFLCRYSPSPLEKDGSLLARLRNDRK